MEILKPGVTHMAIILTRALSVQEMRSSTLLAPPKKESLTRLNGETNPIKAGN